MDVQWSASPGEMLRPDDLGSFDVLEGGTGTITAKYKGAQGTATVTAICDPGVPGCKLPLDKASKIKFDAAIQDSLIRKVFSDSTVGAMCRVVMDSLEADWAHDPD